jgi:2-dehydropantoate 2-reductase
VKVGVLGTGGVGGALAARLARAGHQVTCVATPRTVAAIREHGLTLECQGETITTHPEASEALEDPVDLLLVAVKAPDLELALDRVVAAPAVALPLLNGLEHLELLRRELGPRIAAGSIRIEAYARDRGVAVQHSPFTLVRMASADVPLGPVAEAFGEAGIEAHVEASEKAVLWEKAARLAAIAPATALTQRPVGELREDAAWRPRLEAAIEEACAVATADGAPTAPAEQWGIIDSMPHDLVTSTARDVATGRPSELDAITGAVIRAGRRHRVATPTLDRLLAECPQP